MSEKFNYKRIFLLLAFFVLGWVAAQSQTTEFTYQGRLASSGQTANGNYDFEFKLFEAGSGGAEIISQQKLNVPVAAGVFSVKLDFGGNFSGLPRFLEIAVKLAGNPNVFTTLTPRQLITSAPYAVRSVMATDATRLGGIDSGQYVLTGDPRMSDERQPLAGSNNYIQNTDTQQIANFNIVGNSTILGTLTIDSLNSVSIDTANYKLFGSQILGARGGIGNMFVGFGAGQSIFSGGSNSFFGTNAGRSTTTGTDNSYFGFGAGNLAVTSRGNSYFGANAGEKTTNGTNNSFFGIGSGRSVTTGDENTFFGFHAGESNVFGAGNTAIGSGADIRNNVNRATAIGAGAIATTSNSIVLGTTSDTVIVPGFQILSRFGAAGIQSLCRNAANQISVCSSSLRYKTNIAPFNSGLNLVNRLRPITFNWKDGGIKDLGLGAEDVAVIEPLLATYNEKGEVEGVKYDRLTLVLLNAMKEQQILIDNLKRIVCETNPAEKICKEIKK